MESLDINPAAMAIGLLHRKMILMRRALIGLASESTGDAALEVSVLAEELALLIEYAEPYRDQVLRESDSETFYSLPALIEQIH